MKKLFIAILFFSFGYCYSQFKANINGVSYLVNGELVCSSSANPWNNEENDDIHIDCYANFKSDTLVYSLVTTKNSVVQSLEIFSVFIGDLDLNKAKIDWEKDFYSDNAYGLDKKIDIPIKGDLEKVAYRLWDGNTRPYKTYYHKQIKLNFIDDANAKAFLKKLKLKAKQLKK